mgnify:CR=1 FL=1
MAKKKPLEKRFTRPKGWLTGTFTNARGLGLHYGQFSSHEKPLAHIVFVPGLSEFTEKSYELARDFNRNACNFSVFDRPCQGRSPRLLKDKFKQHSAGMEQDVDDLIDFCKTHVPKGEPIVLFGHSTGGLIALLALQKAPELFKAGIMSAPLWSFKNPLIRDKEYMASNVPLPEMAREVYIPGGGPWKPRHKVTNEMRTDAFSRDPVRNKVHDYWQDKYPVLRTGAPTIGWTQDKCIGIVKASDKKFLKSIKRPVLLFTAGEDALVNNDNALKMIKQIKNAKHVHYNKGRHELLMETDDIRSDLLYKQTIPFLKNNL